MDALIRCGTCGASIAWGAPSCAHCSAQLRHWPTNPDGSPRLEAYALARMSTALREGRRYQALRLHREAFGSDGPTALRYVVNFERSMREAGMIPAQPLAPTPAPDPASSCLACGGPRDVSAECPYCGAPHARIASDARPTRAELAEVEALVRAGQTLLAVQRYRASTGEDLRACKAAIEAIARRIAG